MTEALRTLLAGLIDYAGLFPPANLEMAEAARNYDAYRAGPHSWALGRFILPSARLNEWTLTGVTWFSGCRLRRWCANSRWKLRPRQRR